MPQKGVEKACVLQKWQVRVSSKSVLQSVKKTCQVRVPSKKCQVRVSQKRVK